MAIYEIRDYTIDPEWFDRFVVWARGHAVPWIMTHLDALGFWVHGGEPADVAGFTAVLKCDGELELDGLLVETRLHFLQNAT